MGSFENAPKVQLTPAFRVLPIKYLENGDLHLDESQAPFDGNPVLIQTGTGVVEAWWEKGTTIQTQDGPEADGFRWQCYDGMFELDLEDAVGWMPLPPTLPRRV